MVVVPGERKTMTVRAEIEELVKWISDLQKDKASDPETKTLSREDWLLVEDNLDSVAKRVEQARDELITRSPGSVLREFALDIQREARGLGLRAHLLSRRAEPRAKPAATAASLTPRVRRQEKTEGEQGGEPPTPPSEPEVVEYDAPSDILGRVGNTIETAHKKLTELESPDDDAKAFEGELEVLAEMTLALREGCWELDRGQPRVVQIEHAG
jgi:hypothetical protein